MGEAGNRGRGANRGGGRSGRVGGDERGQAVPEAIRAMSGGARDVTEGRNQRGQGRPGWDGIDAPPRSEPGPDPVPERSAEPADGDDTGPVPARRTGRRAGGPDTRSDILAAARASFAERGYNATTIRGVAATAGVDPALVHYFFGSKNGLFAASMELTANPADVVADLLSNGLDGLGERAARAIIAVWDEPATGDGLRAMLRSTLTHEQSAMLMREYVGRELVNRLAARMTGPDARVRAALISAQIVGMAMARYVLRTEPLASADSETVVRHLGPLIQNLLTGE